MTGSNLGNRMFANIRMNLLDDVNLQGVAGDFAQVSETLINYFGLY